MVVLETIGVAFAMFSALPVPRIDWNERNMRYAMVAFPLIGAVIGALWCVCGALPLPDMLRAAGFCLIPVAVTGGIHLDGYADTSDALSSYGDREKKLDILKDPHCGAFAVIRLCSYFTLYFALCACVRFTPRVGLIWLLALVLERCLSGYAVAAFPMAKNTGLAHTFATREGGAADDGRLCRQYHGVHGRRAARAGGAGGTVAVSRRGGEAVRRRYRGFGGLVFAAGGALDAGGAAAFREVAGMIFITGPLYSGKRTFARRLGGRQMADAQDLAAGAENLERLADELAAQYDVVMATEIGGGIVPLEAEQRQAREAAGRLACLLAARADTVIEMFCGIATVLKGEMPC